MLLNNLDMGIALFSLDESEILANPKRKSFHFTF
jgi:hypothetical protein